MTIELEKRLRGIPADLCWTEDSGSHRNLPVGALSHEAADTIAAQRAEIERLRAGVTLPREDYERLVEAAECDDMIVRCEVCNAWLDRADPACASTEDFIGCWKVAGRQSDQSLCRSYRAIEKVAS